jgi:hypothetical protein
MEAGCTAASDAGAPGCPGPAPDVFAAPLGAMPIADANAPARSSSVPEYRALAVAMLFEMSFSWLIWALRRLVETLNR